MRALPDRPGSPTTGLLSSPVWPLLRRIGFGIGSALMFSLLALVYDFTEISIVPKPAVNGEQVVPVVAAGLEAVAPFGSGSIALRPNAIVGRVARLTHWSCRANGRFIGVGVAPCLVICSARDGFETARGPYR